MNVDRYITDEAVQAVHDHYWHKMDNDAAVDALRAALPTILAQHRTDVLREAADDFAAHGQYPDEIPSLVLRDMAAGVPADEAVAE